MGDLQDLVGMGFSEAKSKKALKQTKNAGLQPALDWLINHADDPEPTKEDDEDMDDDEVEGKASAADLVPKSLKCLQCGKMFRNTALASYHGDKSGHDQFEESTEELKPLTEEEKKAKLEELRIKMLEKKKQKEKEDAVAQKANETIRRKGGKDMGAIREEMRLREAEKAAQDAKREKLEEAKAKARIKEQIEADKRARAEKAAREKALRSGTALPVEASTSHAPPPTSAPGAKKEHNETRLQIRLPTGGQPLTTTLKSTQTLQEVANFVAEKTPLSSGGIKFSVPFPRKTFTPDQMSYTLAELDLVPSSVLIVTEI